MRPTLFLTVFILFCNCGNSEKHLEYMPKPIVSVDSILSSEKAFTKYYFGDVDLENDYYAFSEDGDTIKKLDFLKLLEKGSHIPIKIENTIDKNNSYQLLKLDSSQQIRLSKFVQAKGNQYRVYESLLGKPLPKFDFKDMNDEIFNANNTQGKFVVIKLWFIGCKPCIEEIPELNQLVNKYESYSDIIFISLALDQKKQLESFLSKKEFKYKTIPNTKDYVMTDLGIGVFPTHIILDGNGVVVSVSSNAKQLKDQLENLYR